MENLVGYAKRDLMVPLGARAGHCVDLNTANAAAAAWCPEVNGEAVALDGEVLVGRGDPGKADLIPVTSSSGPYDVPERDRKADGVYWDSGSCSCLRAG